MFEVLGLPIVVNYRFPSVIGDLLPWQWCGVDDNKLSIECDKGIVTFLSVSSLDSLASLLLVGRTKITLIYERNLISRQFPRVIVKDKFLLMIHTAVERSSIFRVIIFFC